MYQTQPPLATIVLTRYHMPMADDEIELATALIERFSRLVASDGQAMGLKPVQWAALRYFSRANRFSRTPGALATYLNSTKGTVSQTVMVLERKGLISKRTDSHDKRSVRIAITEAGSQLLANDPLHRLREAISILPAESTRQLTTDLEQLLRARLAIDGGRAFGICGECRHFRPNDPHGAPHRCALLDEPLAASDAGKICVEQEKLPTITDSGSF